MRDGELVLEEDAPVPYYKPKWYIRWTVTNVWRNTILLVLAADAALFVWALWDLATG